MCENATKEVFLVHSAALTFEEKSLIPTGRIHGAGLRAQGETFVLQVQKFSKLNLGLLRVFLPFNQILDHLCPHHCRHRHSTCENTLTQIWFHLTKLSSHLATDIEGKLYSAAGRPCENPSVGWTSWDGNEKRQNGLHLHHPPAKQITSVAPHWWGRQVSKNDSDWTGRHCRQRALKLM